MAADVDSGAAMSSKTWTLLAAVLGSSIVFLDSAVLTVALPAIGREPRLFVDVLEAQNYIQYGYLLSLSSLLKRVSSSRSALVRPSSSRPALRTDCATQLRIDCAVGSNSRASSSGVRPARTNSTI